MSLFKDTYWLKSGLYSLFQNLIVLVFNFGGVYLLIRVLSKENFGAWAVFLTIVSVLEVARNGMLKSGLIKYLNSESSEAHPKIITASIALNVLISVLCVSLMLLSADYLAIEWEIEDLPRMCLYYAIPAVGLIFFSQFDFINQSNLNFKAIFWVNVVRRGVFFLLIAYCFFDSSSIKLIQLVWFQAISIFVAVFVSYITVRKYLKFTLKIDLLWLKRLFKFGVYGVGTNLGSMLYKSIDQIMLASLISTEAVAKYNISVRITNLVEVPTRAISNIVLPKSAKRAKTDGNKSAKYLYEKSVGVILAILIPAALVVLVFPEMIIQFVAGDEYMDTVSILQVTIFYTFFVPFSRQYGTILDSIGIPHFNFYFTIASAFVNLVLNYLFISNFGVIGAAYGTLLTYFISFIGMQITLKRVLNVSLIQVFLQVKYFYLDVSVMVFNKLIRRNN
ncbi:flippase [Fulvivirga sp. M361]|uniref:flippase n=1 Tax=Fulvivirga sp. M361 TaxID=2594266 RepID=UPI00117A36EA|nr:flippase [Fulvivirga sp. M361]TRX60108.1 flippase [Fulvivirga sp. M361]